MILDNVVILEGRLVNDPKLYSTSNGKSKVFCSVACGYGDYVEFISFTAWDKVAENLAAFTKKGSEVLIKGHLKNKSKDVNGRTEYYLEVYADEIKFIGSKKKEEEKPLEIPDDLVKSDDLPF